MRIHARAPGGRPPPWPRDRKSTRLNSSHSQISYAFFCLEKKSTRLNSSHSQISYAVFCLKKKKQSAYLIWRKSPRTVTYAHTLTKPVSCIAAASRHTAQP